MILGIDATNINAGGGVTHLLGLLQASNPQRHGFDEVILWTGNEELREQLTAPWLHIKFDPHFKGSRTYRYIWQLKGLPKETEKCDLLFVPGGLYLGHFRPFVAMSQNLLPFDDSNPNLNPLFSMRNFRMKALKWGQSRTFRSAKGIIFLTAHAKNTILRRIMSFRGQTAVIPHGINGMFFRPTPPQESVIAYDQNRPFRILYVSTIAFYKHQAEVVEAVGALVEQGMPLELIIAGPALYRDAYLNMQNVIARCNRKRRFACYRGTVAHESLVSLYHSADMFIFASSCENLPLILLEAMAASLPIACSQCAPMPEVLKDGGIYFDPESSDSIAGAVRDLILHADKRKSCAEKAHRYAREYSWQRCADETFSFLASCA